MVPQDSVHVCIFCQEPSQFACVNFSTPMYKITGLQVKVSLCLRIHHNDPIQDCKLSCKMLNPNPIHFSRVLLLIPYLGIQCILFCRVKLHIFFINSFRSVVQGNHTLFREYSYIRKTPHNIASFIRVFWKCFRHIGRNGGIETIQITVDTIIIEVGFLVFVHGLLIN